MKIGIISDTHCRDENCDLELLNEHFQDVDLIIHAGDVGNIFCLNFLSKFAEVIAVSGNNDYNLPYLNEVEKVNVKDLSIGIIHGHQGSRWTAKENAHKALRDFDIIIFGHTHVPLIEKYRDTLMINPGSYNRPRNRDRQRTIAILEINKEVKVEIVKI